jgi:hypothetical protein
VTVRCARCGYIVPQESAGCPLCAGNWEIWELRLPPIPLQKNRDQISAWLSQLPPPIAIEIYASAAGIKVRMFAPPGSAEGAAQAWASMMHQQSRWAKAPGEAGIGRAPVSVLTTRSRLPNLVTGDMNADPLLAIGGQLRNGLQDDENAGLRIWLLGKDQPLQQKLRTLVAYSYGTESGVNEKSPNPWGIRLGILRAVTGIGCLTAITFGALMGGGWTDPYIASVGIAAGGLLAVVGVIGLLNWIGWRSIPKEVLEKRVNETLLSVGFSVIHASTDSLSIVGGQTEWKRLPGDWPNIRPYAMPLPVSEIAALISPPEMGEGSGLLDRSIVQDIPAPAPTLPLVNASFKIGISPSSGQSIGVDPDGHGVATGGSRTGKSSVVFGLLEQLIQRGEDAPGIFLVDPHLSLSDSFLQAIDKLPSDLRAMAIRRLRIITPDQPEVVPLNLLAIPDFSWAGNSMVQIGRRIWDDYWGPRMQAALLALFRIAHAWNIHNPDSRMGLLHVVFAAFNDNWRHRAMQYLPPAERMGSLALDALLGQFGGEGKKWDQGWVTEVISPVLSKVMALELSPWLFAALHQSSFVDLEKWIHERAWVVMRLPSGQMGREGAKLTAGVVYNVFDAAYRRATLYNPIPFYFVIDEAQEIGTGMRLEAMLSEGAKFGARMFVLAQSLSMMRKVEGFEPVVQALLANTSTQTFFSPDPEDALLIRDTLTSTARFGITTLDLPTLHCWLRARVNYAWQTPTLLKVKPLIRPDHERVQALIREVIGAHPEDYVSGELWQDQAVGMLKSMIASPTYQGYLTMLFDPSSSPLDDIQTGNNPVMEREDRAEMDKAHGKTTPPEFREDQRKLGYG